MNLQIKTTIPKFQQAFERAQEVLDNPMFWEAIESEPKFEHTKVSPREIAKLLKETNHLITIIDWKPLGLQAQIRYRKTNALTESKDVIKMNVLKDYREVIDIAGTIIHEGVHAIDQAHPYLNFGHKGNKEKENKNTAPYCIGNLAIRILKGTYGLNNP